MAAGVVLAPRLIPITPTRRAKNHIDTHTPVSMQSDTPGVQIFFTLDGSKPVLVGGQQGAAGPTSRYRDAILLPAGRVTVRAVAATSDGRQSSVVTKEFSVDPVEELQVTKRCVSTRPLEGAGGPQPRCDGVPRPLTGSPGRSELDCPPSGPRFLNRRLTAGTEHSRPEGADTLSRTQTSRAQRQSDFLRCPHCVPARPADPFAHFCAQCGAIIPPLPTQRLPPAEGGKTLQCVFCNTLVPVNTHTCLVCEATIDPQIQPQACRTLQDHVVCVCCGSGNPAHVSSCVTCENRLQQPSVGGSSAPSVHTAHHRLLSCPRCRRRNLSDARYCDWCGSKPGHALRCVTCQRCGASGRPYALYCASCGVFMEAPPISRSDITPVAGEDASQLLISTSHNATWLAMTPADPAPYVTEAPPTADQYTQTIGLFYPSATELQRKQQQRALQEGTREHRPPQGAISPGRGYWRKQLDHVCAHLRSYAQNHAPFRAVLGEPRLGQVVSAVVQEDGYEVSVTASFVLAGCERTVPSGGDTVGGVKAAPLGETLNSVTEGGVHGSPPALRADHQVEDVPLLVELGPGRGRVDAVQELLDQGAEPSCCGSDGRHALAVAVINGHCDVVPVLVQRGADVDRRSGRMKNTALHEAAARGAARLRCAEVLLSCEASVWRLNGAGQTAYDVARNSGCGVMMSLLAVEATDG